MRRRLPLQWMGLTAACAVLGGAGDALAARKGSSQEWFMPDESEPHVRTWMAFGASQTIWGKKLLPRVQRDLASIALAIAKFEPVSMLVRRADLSTAQRLMGEKVALIECPHDDLWMRDTGPVFVVNEQGGKAAVDFNFNGWGEKQDFENDAKVAAFVAQRAGVTRLRTSLILEGGGIEVDGQGTAIITESCVLNDNRNPRLNKAQCEQALLKLLGIEKIIWLPGIKGKDITDGHTDFYARFARPGVVIAGFDPDPQSFDHAVTKKHLEILRRATDAKGRKLDLVVLQAPSKVRPSFESQDFAAGYINFYVCNGAVIAPQFGDAKADAAAQLALRSAFPDRQIIQLDIDGIAAGGGGIHCTTQQEPKV
jgi:agmatine deiminase